MKILNDNLLDKNHFRFIICKLVYKHILLLSFMFFNCLFSFAGQSKLDSLHALLKIDNPITVKINLLNAISREYFNSDRIDSCFQYANTAIDLANSLPNGEGRIFTSASLESIGLCYTNTGNYSKALENLLKALMISDSIMGEISNHSEKQAILNRIAKIYGNIGTVYWKQGNFTRSLWHYNEALKTFQELGDKRSIGIALNNIGNVLSDLKRPDALDYYFKALKIDEELGDSVGMAADLINIGIYYAEQDDRKNALNYYFKGLEVAKNGNAKQWEANALGYIGELYIKENEYGDAEKYLLEAVNMHKQIGTKKEEAQFEEDLSILYSKTNRFQIALEHYKNAMVIKQALSNIEVEKQLARQEYEYNLKYILLLKKIVKEKLN